MMDSHNLVPRDSSRSASGSSLSVPGAAELVGAQAPRTEYILSFMKCGVLAVLSDPDVQQTAIVEALFTRLGAETCDSSEFLKPDELTYLTLVLIPAILTKEFIRGDHRRAMNVAMVVWLAAIFDPTFHPVIPMDIQETMPSELPTGEKFPLLKSKLNGE